MTSPNRETEAQQVKAVVEQIVLTRVKASLGIKRGTTRVNLVLVKITTDQEPVKMVMILKQDLQETVIVVSDQDQVEMARQKASHQDLQETVKDQEQAETAMQKASHQDLQEMVTDQEQAETAMQKASHRDLQEMVTDQEQAETAMQKASRQEVVLAAKHSNHVHLKKAVLKRCQEMKAAVI
jgi:hypothetical protein